MGRITAQAEKSGAGKHVSMTYALGCRYGVPAMDADKLEDVVMKRVYAAALKELRSRERCTEEYLRHTAIRTLLHKTTMFSPKVLLDAGADILTMQPCMRRRCTALCTM